MNPDIGLTDYEKGAIQEILTKLDFAGLAGNGAIMLAFDETFAEHPELVKIVVEEFAKRK